MSDFAQTATDEPQRAKPLSVSYNSISRLVLEIERRILAKEPIAPADLADIRARLCAYYGWANGEYARLKIELNRHHRDTRENFKSDKACEAEWLASESGELYINLKYLRTTLDRLQSSVRTLYDSLQKEQ